MVGNTDQEKSRNGGLTWPEDCFLSPSMQRTRATAHPVPTKGLLQLSPQAAMLSGLSVETRTPPSVPPFLLYSTELVPRTLPEVTSQAESFMMHIHPLRIIG